MLNAAFWRLAPLACTTTAEIFLAVPRFRKSKCGRALREPPSPQEGLTSQKDYLTERERV